MLDSNATIMLWGAGIILLGLVLGFAATRAGRLRRSERETLDRRTEAARQVEEQAEARAAPAAPASSRRFPYAIVVPIALVGFAIVLMIWSMQGTSTGNQQDTTSRVTSQPTSQPAPTAGTRSNDAASDSARGQEPLNRSR